MMGKYKEYKNLNLTGIASEISEYWKTNNIFDKSIVNRSNNKPFVFYEGPPSANGMPGIHHVMSRTIKDIFCRYKTMQGFLVERKAGWDTHGLPVEIGVEKKLSITKEDIGKKISIIDYNKECKKEVMKYKDLWDELTIKMGYWIDLKNPYITFNNKYIESVWFLLKELYKKELLYKGYTIQPYSPAAGTGLSTHELNQPGCYKNVKDNSVVAQFKIIRNETSEFLYDDKNEELFFLAWTTTPWTLPSNTGLAVGENIKYVKIKTYNPYTFKPISIIIAKDLIPKYFNEENKSLNYNDYQPGQKQIPYIVLSEYIGKKFLNIRYEQLLPYAKPTDGDPFRVIIGDFVTTDEGTGIVHIAPSFGADDFRMNKIYKLGTLTLVDKQGKFVKEMGEFAGRYVKPEYDPLFDDNKNNVNNVDIDIIVKLKKENKAFKAEKYEHSYPHCWRTDKPILYYPLDSWFVKTTTLKDRMIELNKTINWKPEYTGTGRFGNWLENLVDWNLSRSRFWGIPLPVWTTEDKSEQICIGSIKELKEEIDKSIAAGYMSVNPFETFIENDFSEENYNKFDLHRPYVDEIILVSPSGKKMYRETDLIDVWFDSGAMPYAQFHYPFENQEYFKTHFPADFIAEGVDQTRGWFFTLHAIAVMLFDSVAFKNVVSNGLVLDKKGNKMSKRLGNAIDPFETINKLGPDATRWYMITNAQPWDNLKFDIEGVEEVQRKFFGTLYNTYAFFALYANIDGFNYSQDEIPIEKRPEIDKWIISELNTLIKNVSEYYDNYEPTKAGRAIEEFVDEYLSNWYVRLSRRRFWKGSCSEDKISAYQTLYNCLEKIAMLMAPIAPFFAEKLFIDLNNVTKKNKAESVHLTNWPSYNENNIDKELETRMQLAKKIASMILALRKKAGIRVRQPLKKIMIPCNDEIFKTRLESISEIILAEVNVKEIEYIDVSTNKLVKTIKPNFKSLGPRFGKLMKQITEMIENMTQKDIINLEKTGTHNLTINNQTVTITTNDVEIITEDIPGFMISTNGNITVALDITITPELKAEGIARELINRIQNIRKEKGFEVTDKIIVEIENNHNLLSSSINNNFNYICSEILASKLYLTNKIEHIEKIKIEIDEEITTYVTVNKVEA